MAITGVKFKLSENDKEKAIKYVKESGFFKGRLADFLEISRPTLNKIIQEDTDFFTSLRHADSIFCKSLIDEVKKKNPIFLLRMRYKEEFNDSNSMGYDPEVELKRLNDMIIEMTSKA